MEKKRDVDTQAHIEAGEVGEAFFNMALKEKETSAFDPKTHELAFLSVLTAVRLNEGIVTHTKEAKRLGASREEVKSAVLLPLPIIGFPALIALEIALASYDEEE